MLAVEFLLGSQNGKMGMNRLKGIGGSVRQGVWPPENVRKDSPRNFKIPYSPSRELNQFRVSKEIKTNPSGFPY